MAMRKMKHRVQESLSQAEYDNEREQLLALRRQPNVDKKLIDLALKSTAPRMTPDEISEYLGRVREGQQ